VSGVPPGDVRAHDAGFAGPLSEPRRVRQKIESNLEGLFLKEVVAAPCADGARLAMVRKRLADGRAPRGAVLLLHGITQNRYCWHLTRRSFANFLAFGGYDVYNADLRGVGRSRALGAPFPAAVDDHVELDVPALVDAVRRHSGEERIFVVGFSLGGALAYAAAPRIEGALRGLVTFAGAYQLGRGLPALRQASRLCLELDRRFGPAPRGAPSPAPLVGWLFHQYARFFNGPLNLLPLAAWEPGAMEGDLVLEWAKRAFDKTSYGVTFDVMRWAADKRFTDSTGGVDYAERWRSAEVPVLVLAGSHDLLNAPRGVKAAYDQARSPDRTYRELGPEDGGKPWGHVDLILGRRAPTYVWPMVLDWLGGR
jgi:alpha-beta hydrolase superfamily lysophospholipase